MFEWLFGKKTKFAFTLGSVVVEVDTVCRGVKVVEGWKICALMLDDVDAITWGTHPKGYEIKFMVAGAIGVSAVSKWQPDHSKHSELVKFIKKYKQEVSA